MNQRICDFLTFIIATIVLGANAHAAPSPLPTVVGNTAGSLAGSFEVTPSGAATYSIPLALPPGSGGMEPKLGLNYSSQAGDSFLGYGWTISGLSSISRCLPSAEQDPVFNLINYDEHDRYCLDGQKLTVVSGAYSRPGSEYRTINETFSKVIANGHSGPYWGSGPESFTVYNKNGLIYEYGAAPDSRLEAAGAEGILSWLVKKVSDRNGNYYEISYQKNLANGELLPLRIDYTGNTAAGVVPYSSVSFLYDSRPIRSRYLGGQAYLTRNRLSRIEISNENALVWYYALSYASDQVKLEDLLTSVQECDAQNFCLPATTFTWGDAPTAGLPLSSSSTLNDLGPTQGYINNQRSPIFTGDWNGDSRTDIGRVLGNNVKFYTATTAGGFELFDQLTFSLPLLNNDSDGDAFPILVGDWNGDGQSDFMRANLLATGATPSYYYYISTGTGFSSYRNTSRSEMFEMGSCDYTATNRLRIIAGDWNGDGRTDVGRISSDNCSSFAVWQASGNSFHSSAPALSSASGCSLNECPYFTGDWNGDGLTDIARVVNDRVKFYSAVRLNNAPLFDFREYANIIEFSPAQGYSDIQTHPLVIGDWNNDGLTDFGRLGNSGLNLCIGLGQPYYIPSIGFAACQNYPILSPAQGFASTNAAPLLIGDWNGDGSTDIARIGPGGIVATAIKEFVPSAVLTAPLLSQSQGFGSGDTNPTITGDWNGDGMADLARVSNSGIEFVNQASSDTNALHEIRNGYGGVVRISYSKMSDPSLYTKGNGGSFTTGIDIQSTLRLVRSVESTDDISSSLNLSYKYKSYRYNPTEREGYGFGEISVTNHLYNTVKTDFYRQDSPSFNGLLLKTETRLANGTLISKTENTWAAQGISPSQINHYIAQSNDYIYELDGAAIQSAQTNYWVDPWGNTSVIQTTRSDGSSESTNTTYLNDPANWIIGVPSQSAVTKTAPTSQGGSSEVKRANFTYQSGSGRLLAEITEQGAIDEISRSYSYDVFGNVVGMSAVSPNLPARSTLTAFDSKGRFPISITNPLGQTENRTYSSAFGKPLTITTINGLTSRFYYDSFGRDALIEYPDGTKTRTLYLLATPSPSLPNDSYIIRTDTSGGAPVIRHYDSLAREIRTETRGFGGQWIYVDKQYDDSGRLVRQSEPYFAGDVPLWTVTQYDQLDRITAILEPGNRTTSMTYAPHWTYRTNPMGQTMGINVDDQGRMIQSVDAAGHSMTYRYNAYGQLIASIDALGNTTSNVYNSRGSKTQTTTPDSGTTNYTYNAFGEMLQQTNANGETINFSYDLLGRMTQRISPEGTEAWIYDTAVNGTGKIHKILGLNAYEETYSYDSLSRLSSLSKKIAGKNYLISQSYSDDGLVLSTTYPTGLTIFNSYDSNGELVALQRMDTKTILWRALAKNARDQLTRQRAGNGLTTDRSYDPATGLIRTIQTGINGVVQNLNFQFDLAGNLTARADLINNVSENFSYDNLNRLISTQVSGQAAVSASYDWIGNLTNRSDVGAYLYGQNGAGPHAVSSIVGQRPDSYTYDNAGNRLTSVGGSISYNSNGIAVSISKGSSSLNFQLSPAYDRTIQDTFKRGLLSERKVYFNKSYEEITQGGRIKHIHYISAGEQPIAIITSTAKIPSPPSFKEQYWSNQVRYLHHDHLGSPQVITNEQGTPVETLSFSPWGERRHPFIWTPLQQVKSSVDLGFTGHEQMDEVDLVHMNGRVYDPVIGRFTSPDPFVQSESNMQSFNRYSYVNNNPLSFIDPSGFFLGGFLRKIGRFINRNLPMIVAAASMYFAPVYFTQIFTMAFPSLTCSQVGISVLSGLSGVASGVVSSGISSVVSGGGLWSGIRSGIKSAHLSFIGAFSANYIGTRFEYSNGLTRAAAHAVTNGAVGAASGEKFMSGFASSFAGSMGGDTYLQGLLASGLSSTLSGGKFSQGLMRGALVHMFNDRGDGHQHEDLEKPWLERKLGTDNYEMLGDVLMNFKDEHPVYIKTVEYGSVVLSFTSGGILAAGLRVPKIIGALDLSFATLSAVWNKPEFGDWSVKGMFEVTHTLLKTRYPFEPVVNSAIGHGQLIYDGAAQVYELDKANRR